MRPPGRTVGAARIGDHCALNTFLTERPMRVHSAWSPGQCAKLTPAMSQRLPGLIRPVSAADSGSVSGAVSGVPGHMQPVRSTVSPVVNGV